MSRSLLTLMPGCRWRRWRVCMRRWMRRSTRGWSGTDRTMTGSLMMVSQRRECVYCMSYMFWNEPTPWYVVLGGHTGPRSSVISSGFRGVYNNFFTSALSDGTGYVEDGREIFDEDLEDPGLAQSSKSKHKNIFTIF